MDDQKYTSDKLMTVVIDLSSIIFFVEEDGMNKTSNVLYRVSGKRLLCWCRLTYMPEKLMLSYLLS